MEIRIEKEFNRALVSLSGRFDLTANLTFRNATRPLIGEDEVETVVIDFHQVPFMDSSALGLLLLLREQATAAKKTVVLRKCGPDLERVLSISNFNKMFVME